MPIIADPRALAVDPDDLPGLVITAGVLSRRTDLEIEPHRHRKSQLLFWMHGTLSCTVENNLWIVPSHSAIWIPGGLMHAVSATGTIEGYSAFIDPDADPRLPKNCCTIAVSPLLRELLMRSAGASLELPAAEHEERIAAVVVDEIAASPSGRLSLPIPSDPRLQRITAAMLDRTNVRLRMSDWAKSAGFSERTMARMIVRETGMAFGRWRQQILIMLAVDRLAAGHTIQQVSAELGYESASSFVSMFRRMVGTSPGRYMSERHSSPSVHTRRPD